MPDMTSADGEVCGRGFGDIFVLMKVDNVRVFRCAEKLVYKDCCQSNRQVV